jgi:hypothetical protein
VATATWGRQTEASIQWGDNQFRFLEVPEKTPIFIFFLKKFAAHYRDRLEAFQQRTGYNSMLLSAIDRRGSLKTENNIIPL